MKNNMPQKKLRSSSKFVRFIERDDYFNIKEKEHIIASSHNSYHQRAFKLAVLLVFWSIVGSFIDSVLIGGGVFFSITEGLHIKHFIPEFIFFLVNFFLKSTFIFWYMKNQFSYPRSLLCATPYLDSFIVLGCILKDDPLFVKGIKRYLNHLRKSLFKNILNI